MTRELRKKIKAAADRTATLATEVGELVKLASKEYIAAGYDQTTDPTGKTVDLLNDAEDHLTICLQLLNAFGGTA